MKDRIVIQPVEKAQRSESTFCILPWIAQHVTTTGDILPCCEYQRPLGTIDENGLTEVWNGDKLKKLRDELGSGTKSKGCWRCFEREKTEGRSIRTESNGRFKDWVEKYHADPDERPVPPDRPVAYDLRMSNLCNLKCRSCGHFASSKWFSDSKKLGLQTGEKAEVRSFKNESDVQKQFLDGLDTLEEIYFAGGEPIMMAEHFRILDMLLDKGKTDVWLRYTTNMSILLLGNRNVLDLWKQFPNVSVEASIDAIGDRGALMRNGFDWETWSANLSKVLHECPHISLHYGITVSAMNILAIPDLLRELKKRFHMLPRQLQMHSLQDPVHYRSQILPEDLKYETRRRFTKFRDEINAMRYWQGNDAIEMNEKLTGLLNFMDAEDRTSELENFRSYNQSLDELRAENFKETFPELVSTWHQPGIFEQLKNRFWNS